MLKKRFNLATLIGFVLLAAALAFMFTYFAVERQFEQILQLEQSEQKRLEKVSRVLDIIENEFVGEYDYDTLLDGAAMGIVAATGDRWSFYMTAEEYEEYVQSSLNAYVGIGVTVVYDAERDGILVVRVHEDSPAESSDIKVRDLIVAVGDNRVSDIGYTAAVEQVRGEEGSTVDLTVIREGTNFERKVTVGRGNYLYNPIISEIIDGNIGVMKIENFDANASVYFEEALDNLLAADVNGIIFDVRNNGGGRRDEMVDMLDRLCPEGVLFSMRDKHGNEETDYSDSDEVNLPMVVIVNENSYSAAEFFAAALQEYGKAQIVGVETSGKGYAQQTRVIGDGSAMNISISEYFTPKGKTLVGTGVTLDERVEQKDTTNLYLIDRADDSQFQSALRLLYIQMQAGVGLEG